MARVHRREWRVTGQRKACRVPICFSPNSWYMGGMFKAYIGIADSEGLESFIPEGEVPVEWLTRVAHGSRVEEAVCYYAVLSDEAAQTIRAELDASRRLDALHLLDGLALELRPIH